MAGYGVVVQSASTYDGSVYGSDPAETVALILTPTVPEDVATLARPVLGHRLLMASGAAFGGTTSAEVIDGLLQQVPVPRDRA